MKEIREKLHCRLRVVSSGERKAKLSREFNRENNQFVSSQKIWFKQKENKCLEDKGGNQLNTPRMNEFETFWGLIWKNLSVNKEVWTEIMTVVNKHVEISIQGDDNPNLTVKHLRRVLRRIKPLGGTFWNQLAAFWWKMITSVHYIMIQIVTRLFEEGECPERETLGRTVLISKRGKTLEKAEYFRPITCLSVIYNI